MNVRRNGLLLGFGDGKISEPIPIFHFRYSADVLVITCLNKGVMDQSDERLKEKVFLDCSLMQEGNKGLER